ncbi:hypothetical protein TNCT_734391 [Trichonephila clavata]|uniref:Uncharacterized protein n=1 Tax=Trichonephila clavata TaxID=2740835 RepID=A0A8X6LMS4_TRICU|nr:hypothetical protein TNCT_734391 [Trichonephila clavata]
MVGVSACRSAKKQPSDWLSMCEEISHWFPSVCMEVFYTLVNYATSSRNNTSYRMCFIELGQDYYPVVISLSLLMGQAEK